MRRWRAFESFRVELEELVGAEAVSRLLASFAGRRIYVPRSGGDAHPIVQAIGRDAAKTLFEYWHGTDIEFPAPIARRQRILDLKRAGRTTSEIAAQLLVSERHVREVVAEARDTRQLSLL